MSDNGTDSKREGILRDVIQFTAGGYQKVQIVDQKQGLEDKRPDVTPFGITHVQHVSKGKLLAATRLDLEGEKRIRGLLDEFLRKKLDPQKKVFPEINPEDTIEIIFRKYPRLLMIAINHLLESPDFDRQDSLGLIAVTFSIIEEDKKQALAKIIVTQLRTWEDGEAKRQIIELLGFLGFKKEIDDAFGHTFGLR